MGQSGTQDGTALPKRQLGRTGLEVGILGAGTAGLGGMYAGVPVRDALGTLNEAWDLGVTYFDTAPMYGLGKAELLLGHVLRQRQEEGGGSDFVLSSKVGRLMIHERPGRAIENRLPPNPYDSGWINALPFEEVFDYSYDGVMRSFDDSLARLGLGRIDILQIHDIGRATHGALHDHHWAALTKGGGFRALEALRSAGLIRGVGVGANETEVIRDALEEFDLDCCLLAGRYTLLDQAAIGMLLPLAEQRGVAVVIGGAFNSGILAAPPGAPRKFNYRDADEATIRRYEAIAALCARHDVAVPAAALQFPLAHPSVATVLVGCRTAAEMRQAAGWIRAPIPTALWTDLQRNNLLDPAAAIPS
jgi:D-threo-aldose 1-dehydrogenase